jgi:ribosomal protein S18 acetylase RimI-like enzyme
VDGKTAKSLTCLGRDDAAFRRLVDADVDAAVAILDAASEWLLARGIRQWTRAYPRELYQQLQKGGQNFGLFEGRRLVAIVTLTSAPPEWQAELAGQEGRWMSKLAVAPDCHGRGIGRAMAEHALDQLRRDGATRAWLDCRNGPLVAFYESLGFQCVAAKVVDFPDVSLDLVLMKRDL